ncbi:ROK family protein [Microbacterium deminutum]|uniref:ROK family transcriptional regulator n=1 Tax=Microbacterium deminutum TaxID=344164 RepID=A0ABN2QTN8_9MICO
MSESIDQLNMRRSNLALILAELIREPRTRAQLASDIEMTKGAVGSLVNELMDRGLVQLSAASSSGGVGRPGQVAMPVGERVHSVGLSFSPPYVIGTSVDLTGRVIAREHATLVQRHTAPDELMEITRAIVERLDERARVISPRSLLAGVAVGVPDLIDPRAGIVRRSPTVGLTDYPLTAVLRATLDGITDNVNIDNDANYGAIAEGRRRGPAGGANLLYLTGSTAMGGGILVDGSPFRGSAGFAGEVGHMLVNPEGKLCVCGSIGCWESEIGLNAFLALAADPEDPVRDSSIDGDERVAAIVQRAEAGEPRALQAIQHVGRYLGLGLSSLINIFNPDTVIVGGYFIRLFPFLEQQVLRIVHQRVLSERLVACQILRSDLDMYAGAIGAATSIIDELMADPTVVPDLRQASVIALGIGATD